MSWRDQFPHRAGDPLQLREDAAHETLMNRNLRTSHDRRFERLMTNRWEGRRSWNDEGCRGYSTTDGSNFPPSRNVAQEGSAAVISALSAFHIYRDLCTADGTVPLSMSAARPRTGQIQHGHHLHVVMVVRPCDTRSCVSSTMALSRRCGSSALSFNSTGRQSCWSCSTQE